MYTSGIHMYVSCTEGAGQPHEFIIVHFSNSAYNYVLLPKCMVVLLYKAYVRMYIHNTHVEGLL